MKLIVGLGNPGDEYAKSRHNVGFMFIDTLAQISTGDFAYKVKFKAEILDIELAGENVLLIKPQTFMNKSGEAILSLTNFYKVDPQDTWVIYDDLDLPFGEIRILPQGGPGTHNGMKSIIELIGEKFNRIRIGIENRAEEQRKFQDSASYVLENFNQKEKSNLDKLLAEAAKALSTCLELGIDKGMNKFNGKIII